MKTSEFIEKVLDIKLLGFQKKYLDYMDKHPDTKIVMPRGRTCITTSDLWVLSQMAMKGEMK